MIKDRDVRNALDTLISEIQAQESQIEYLNREVDSLIANNNSLLDQVDQLSEENVGLKLKIKALEDALTEAHLTSKEQP